jgi:cytoskeletal protein CcmA (bactofilin family)
MPFIPLTTFQRAMTAAVFCLVAGAAAGEVSASVFRSGKEIKLSSLHSIDDDFFVYAERLTVDGNIDGDLMGLTFRSVVRGRIGGSANVICRALYHQGTIESSLRAFADSVEIEGSIGRSAEIVGNYIRTGAGADVQRDVSAVGATVQLDGLVGGKVTVRAQKVFLAGEIVGDVDIQADKISLAPSATIGGNLSYMTPSEDDLEIAAGADLRGEAIWRTPKPDDSGDSGGAVWQVIRVSGTLAAFIFGIIAVRLFRPYAEESFRQLSEHKLVSFAVGLLGLMGVAICLLLLGLAALSFATGLGLMLSEGLTGLGLVFLAFASLATPIAGFASVCGGIMFYSGWILVAFWIGYVLLGLRRRQTRALGAGSLLLGLVILLVLFWIPFLGDLVYPIATVWGLGAILLGIARCRRATPEQPASGATATPPEGPTGA